MCESMIREPNNMDCRLGLTLEPFSGGYTPRNLVD